MERFIDHFREEHLELLRSRVLFRGMTDEEIRSFITHANPYYVPLYEGQSMRMEREYTNLMGLIISGRTHIYSVGYDGSRALLRSMEAGDASGMLYSMLDYQNSLIEFTAFTDSEMMLFSPESITDQEAGDVQVQHKILVNLIQSQRRLFSAMMQHLACLSQRNVREKVLRFLRNCTEQAHSYEIDVPFTREELADYLAVDRASLSRTLGELRREGVIDFRRSHFRILSTQYFQY